jgi:hypothetical protein
MRLPFPLRLQSRRGLLVYQLVLILIAIIILILVLFYVARRNQIGTTSPTPSADTTAAVSTTHPSSLMVADRRLST